MTVLELVASCSIAALTTHSAPPGLVLKLKMISPARSATIA
jgi:hypothetical protein